MKINLEIDLEEIKYIIDWIEQKDVLRGTEHQLWHLVEDIKKLQEDIEQLSINVSNIPLTS